MARRVVAGEMSDYVEDGRAHVVATLEFVRGMDVEVSSRVFDL